MGAATVILSFMMTNGAQDYVIRNTLKTMDRTLMHGRR